MNSQTNTKAAKLPFIRSLKLDNILEDPFKLATVLVSVVRWPLPYTSS